MSNFALMKNYNILQIAISFGFLANTTVTAATIEKKIPTSAKAAIHENSIADTSKVFNLDEVFIVSQPKENKILRKQPIASSIFTSTQFAQLEIRDIHDLANYVPSLQMPSYGSRLTSTIYMRGIGSRVNNPAVGVYLDGMPILSKSAYNMHFYQIGRVDVLRGPQGTLYGMNTEGGLLRLYSKNPMTYKGTDIKLSIGNKLYRNAEVATYNKINEKTAISVAAFYSGQNGFFRNTTTGKHADLYNETGGRLRLVKMLSDKWDIDWMTDYQYINQNGFAYGEYDINSDVTASPKSNRESSYRRNMLNSVMNLKYTSSETTINSTTSYQFLKDKMHMDQDYTSLDYMHLLQEQLQNGITQEFTVKHNNRKWNYTTGAFCSYQWQHTDAPVFFDSDFKSNLANTIESAAHGFIKVDGIDMSVPGLFHTPQFNIGVFHESSLDITEKLVMIIGLRYDYSHSKIEYSTSAEMSMSVSAMGQSMSSTIRSILNNSQCNSFNQVLPKLGFTWKINNGSNIYALVNKGYRSGGYNIQMFSDILQSELQANRKAAMAGNYDVPHSNEDYANINSTISYKPEFSWNYELGAHLNLFGNSVHADISTYYIKIRNQQLSVMADKYGYGRMMINTGRSHSCGFEAAVSGKAIDNRLSWNATYNYTRSIFDNYTENNGDNTKDYSKNDIPYIPKHTMSIAANWTVPFKHNYIKSVVIGANTTAQGKTYWDEANTFCQNFYAIVGAHADINLKNMSISLWGRNITATKYNTFAFKNSATGKTMYLAQRGMPMQVGVDMNFHF